MGFRSAAGTLLGKHGTGLPPGRSCSHSRFHHARALEAWSGLPRAALARFVHPPSRQARRLALTASPRWPLRPGRITRAVKTRPNGLGR
jgi:hypothetical protein